MCQTFYHNFFVFLFSFCNFFFFSVERMDMQWWAIFRIWNRAMLQTLNRNFEKFINETNKRWKDSIYISKDLEMKISQKFDGEEFPLSIKCPTVSTQSYTIVFKVSKGIISFSRKHIFHIFTKFSLPWIVLLHTKKSQPTIYFVSSTKHPRSQHHQFNHSC